MKGINRERCNTNVYWKTIVVCEKINMVIRQIHKSAIKALKEIKYVEDE